MFVEFFLRRPVFAAVCSIIITLVGGLAVPRLPIAQYPDLAPPQVVVTATYVGASADVVENAVTVPLEQELNGVEGMKYISSTSSSDGVSTITITFESSRDLEIATVDVQNRVARAATRLPQQVNQSGIVVNKAVTQQLCAFGLFSEDDRYDSSFLTNYADVYIRDALKRVPGVGDVRIYGERRLSMRIWLDPPSLAKRGLTAQDVQRALQEQNIQVAAGAVGAPPAAPEQPFQLQVRAQGRLVEPEQFGAIVIQRGPDGELVRLEDVARIELGAESYRGSLLFDSHSAVGIGIFQLPSANSLEVRDGVVAELARLSKNFPPGMVYKPGTDTTLQVRASMKGVTETLIEAIALVIFVIFLFLHGWRAVLITALTLPVSLLGTFAFVELFGFSINTLTLFGLTLATGLVVDDAIVVLENIERVMRDRALDAWAGSREASREVSGAVVAMSLVLIAVFLPVAFFPGTLGIIYRQFALTIAASIGISTFCALTLTPALAALLLRPHHGQKFILFRAVDRGLNAFRDGYVAVLRRILRHKLLVVLAFVGCIGLTAYLFEKTPKGFIPAEDQGYFLVSIQGPEGMTLTATEDILRKVDKILTKHPEVRARFMVGGSSPGGSGSNHGTIYAILTGWETRTKKEQSVAGLVAQLRGPLSQIGEARVVPVSPPTIRGVGAVGGFQLVVKDTSAEGDLEALGAATSTLMSKAGENKKLTAVNTSFTINTPVVNVEVDRDRAKALGVPIDQVYGSLQLFMGSLYVNDFNYGNRTYRVFIQADQEFRDSPEDIGSYYVRSDAGKLIPLETFAQVTMQSSAPTLRRYNLFRSAELTGSGAEGVSSGEAMAMMEQIAAQNLPDEIEVEWTGLSLEQKQAGSQTFAILGLGLVFVFLVLAAQYESFKLPFAVILSVPLAMLGALGLQLYRDLANDIFCQVGMVMLIGLASKNAILIVEFAEQLRARGKAPLDAVVEAAALRMRPILMTSIAFLGGVMPLMFSTGAGAGARISLGTAVFGGMLVSTLINLIFTPGLYVVLQRGGPKPPRVGQLNEPATRSGETR